MAKKVKNKFAKYFITIFGVNRSFFLFIAHLHQKSNMKRAENSTRY